MKKTILRLVSTTFVDHMKTKLPPGGQPSLYHWQAECNVLIDAVEDPAEPKIGKSPSKDLMIKDVLKEVLEYIFTLVQKAHVGDWQMELLCYLLRAEASKSLDEIIELLKHPVSPSGHEIPTNS